MNNKVMLACDLDNFLQRISMEDSTGRVLRVTGPLSQPGERSQVRIPRNLLQNDELRVRFDHGFELADVQLPAFFFRGLPQTDFHPK